MTGNNNNILDFIHCFKSSLSNSNDNFYFLDLQKLSNGINVDYCFVEFQHTPFKVNLLWMAVMKKRLDLVQFLVRECRANLDFRFLNDRTIVNNSYPLRRCTALFVAVYLKYYEITKYLVEMGADVNIPNAFGVTPLMQSVDNKKIFQYLIENGKVNVNIRDAKGLTVLDYAIRNYHFETGIMLLGVITITDDLLIKVAYRLNFCNDKSNETKIKILEEFIERDKFINKSVIANAYELLSVNFLNIVRKNYCLNKAMRIRKRARIKKNILLSNASLDYNYSYKNFYHYQFVNIIGKNNVEFINSFSNNCITSKIQEIFICERVLSHYSRLFINKILDLSKLYYIEEENITTSFNLLIYALQFCLFNEDIASTVIDIVETFFTLFENNYRYEFLNHLLTRLINKEFKHVKNDAYNQLLYYTLDLLYLFIENNNNEENNNVIQLLFKQNFYTLRANNETFDSLLHIIISNDYEKHVYKRINNNEDYIFQIQSSLLKYLILDCNVDINCINSYNTTPLFILLKNFNDDNKEKSLNLIKLLVIELGADIHQIVSLTFNRNVQKNYDVSCYNFVMNNLKSCCNDDCSCYDDNFSDEICQIFNDNIMK